MEKFYISKKQTSVKHWIRSHDLFIEYIDISYATSESVLFHFVRVKSLDLTQAIFPFSFGLSRKPCAIGPQSGWFDVFSHGFIFKSLYVLYYLNCKSAFFHPLFIDGRIAYWRWGMDGGCGVLGPLKIKKPCFWNNHLSKIAKRFDLIISAFF